MNLMFKFGIKNLTYKLRYVWVERVGFIFNKFKDQEFAFFSRYRSGIFNLITITCHFLHSPGRFAYFFFFCSLSHRLNQHGTAKTRTLDTVEL